MPVLSLTGRPAVTVAPADVLAPAVVSLGAVLGEALVELLLLLDELGGVDE
jgi:hypothetical protein